MTLHPVLSPGRTRGRPALLRGLNSFNALSFIQEEGASTGTRLAGAIGVSRTAIEAILTDLIDAGWLAKVSPEDNAQLGRPAARYDLDLAVGSVAAIEFDSARTAAVVSDYRGHTLGVAARTVTEGLDGEQRVRLGVDLLDEALTTAQVEKAAVRCVGAASPGVIAQGHVTHFGGHGMPGWIGRDLAGELRTALSLPVVLEGDSALGALAERRRGAGRRDESFVYIYSSRRTGAAIVSDGHLLRGSHGAVGLIGELPELRWRELEDAAYGEAPASDDAAIIGLGIAAMILAVDPALVVIGGPHRDHIAHLLPQIQAEVRRRCPVPPRIELGAFGSDAVMRGAVCLAMDTLNAALSRAVAAGEPLPGPSALSRLVVP